MARPTVNCYLEVTPANRFCPKCQRAEPDRWPPGFCGALRPFSEPPTRGRSALADAAGGHGTAVSAWERRACVAGWKRLYRGWRTAQGSARYRRSAGNADRARQPRAAHCNTGCTAVAVQVDVRERAFAHRARARRAPQVWRYVTGSVRSVPPGRSYTRDSLHAAQSASTGVNC